MKQQRLNFKLLALILFGMFLLLAVYGGYSILTYGNRWFSSSRNPRVRAQKENVVAGDILDRNGVTLASTSDGERVYQADEAAAGRWCICWATRRDRCPTAWKPFRQAICTAFRPPCGSGFQSVQRREPPGGQRDADHR